MHARDGVVFCPECGSQLGDEAALAGRPDVDLTELDFGLQAG